MSDFASFLQSSGLIPGEIVADGKWRRCATEAKPRKKNGSYKLAQDGGIGWCQNFEIHGEPLTWRPDADQARPAFDRGAFARRKAAERRALMEATRAAQQFYLCCELLRGGHPYLATHELNMAGCFGLKVDRDGWLVIPVMLGASLLSVQRISPEGEKKFWYGASVKGGSYTIERPAASLNVLCEGFATGAAIFAAAPLARVVVAFNAGNLVHVPLPRGMAVVAADNDHETAARIGRNPGVLAAQQAGEALGCGVAIPTGIDGTDWADYRQEMAAKRLANRAGRQREGDIRRAVDSEIAAAMMRHARLRNIDRRYA